MKQITLFEYTEFVRKLFAMKNSGADGFMHAASGNSGEAGEVLDHVKKHWIYGKPIDREKMLEEMGDQLFYYVALMQVLGTDLWEIINNNVEKLNKRYPDGYSAEAAIARRDMVDQRGATATGDIVGGNLTKVTNHG